MGTLFAVVLGFENEVEVDRAAKVDGRGVGEDFEVLRGGLLIVGVGSGTFWGGRGGGRYRERVYVGGMALLLETKREMSDEQTTIGQVD